MTDYKEQKAIYDEVQEPMKDVNNRVSADEAFNPMTRLEKAKELRPGLTEVDLLIHRCPSQIFGKGFPHIFVCDFGEDSYDNKICKACWNEEYKE